ncbi:MAG: glutathione S-transferase family protein [Hyphomicrobiales bacterium]
MSAGSYTLLGCPGWGSALVEAALTLCDLPFAFEAIDMKGGKAARERLTRLNPLGEVPTLILPGGETMTESAAIMLYLADLVPHTGLVPLMPGARRTAFLRWLVFIVAAVYPTFTYGDDPSRYVSSKAAQDELRAATDAVKVKAWSQLEAAVDPAPWMLGGFTALDIYVTVMVHWRPGKSWFVTNCPKLDRVADEGLKLPKLRSVWEHNKFIGGA